MSSKQAPYAVEMLQVVKRFSQVLAVDHARSQVKQERSICYGRNGAGKSNSSCAFCCFYTADSGTIRINGETVKMTDPGGHRPRIGWSIRSLCWFPGLMLLIISS